MRRKHRRQLFILALAYLFFWTSGATPEIYGAASGHYTDLLPNPTSAPGITSGTVFYNGYDWQITTLGASQANGDALSRAPYTAYQAYTSSAIANTANVTTFTAITGVSAVGSRTFPATWIAAGRSIRISTKGWYSTTSNPNWTWTVALGTTTIMTTAAQASPLTQTRNWFSAVAMLTISTTGASGTVNGTYDILVGSGTIGTNNVVAYSTNTTAAVPVDLTSQLLVNPTFQWGTASTSNVLNVNQVIVEFLN